MKARLRKTLILYASIVFVGIIYAIICSKLGFGIPCLFRKVTGLMCPGCGISRMCLALLKLDFHTAFESNPMVLILSPLLIAVFADVTVEYIKTGSSRAKGWTTVVSYVIITALLVFGVVRNF